MDALIDTILNEIRKDEATRGNEYLGCDWLYRLARREDLPHSTLMEVLCTRLSESERDARAFVLNVSSSDPTLAMLDVDELTEALEVAASVAPESLLMATEKIAATFGRRKCPDLVVRHNGEHYDTFVKAGRAAMNDVVAKAAPQITVITTGWSLVDMNLLTVETLVTIARKVTISPMGIAFITKVLMRLSPQHHAANELLGRVMNAIAKAPMSPEQNAAVLYRFAIMAGVELNVVGMPEWRDDNRVGTVPSAWFNTALRESVKRNGWTFVKPKVEYGMRDRHGKWTAEIDTGANRIWYRHNPERWNDMLQSTDEVMVPTQPLLSMPRDGDGKYASIVIGFHPVAVPTVEMIRQIK